ncbi:MAG: hypothetical protein AB1Z55_07645 [Acidimicrobiia bacterium]
MNLEPVITTIETHLDAQLRLVGDPAVAEAGRLVGEALRPALREAALALARQATDEVAAQLPGRSVDVVLDGDDPTIRIGDAAGTGPVDADLDARITLRLPTALKELIEGAASSEGDSVNAWIVKSLNTNATGTTGPSRVRGTYEL